MKRLFKFGLFVAVVVGVLKLVEAQKAEWSDLTEDQLRSKLDSKLGDKVPEDKLTEIGDKVVGAMRAKGKLREDEAPDPGGISGNGSEGGA